VEQQERQALAEEKLVLQFRLRELSSLNELFKKQLDENEGMAEFLRDVEKGLAYTLESTTIEEARQRTKALLDRLRTFLAGRD
jgi:hypothetical protein